MKNIETHYGNNWLDKLLNAWPLCIDADSTRSLIEVEYGANDASPDRPDLTNITVRVGKNCTTRSLFRNGLIYVRVGLPFWIGVHIRWCGACRRAFLQAGIGWKMNGRFAVLFRIQSDASAEQGTWGRNLGQAHGWLTGEH